MIPEIQYLLSIESKGIKLGLERTKNLSKACGDPHQNLHIIQVAGTNGKGSTCAMIANILNNANYKVGLFTSPHLIHINERIRINGKPIPDDEIKEYIRLYKTKIKKNDASFFETITIMAFWYFQKMKVDYAIMETGLGGRLDSVSICNPRISVITSISLDHTEILGDTLAKITKEKVGIIKPNTPCVTIQHSNKEIQRIIESECMKKNSPLIISNNLTHSFNDIGLKGTVQLNNAHLARVVINTLKPKLNPIFIEKGLQSVKWHGRNQIIMNQPLIIFDVAHNESGITSFINFYKTLATGNKTLIISLQKRKNIDSQINRIENIFDEVIICETKNKRTMTVKDLQAKFTNQVKIKIIKSDYEAITYALNKAQKNDSIGIIGTHFLGDAVAKIFNISFNLL